MEELMLTLSYPLRLMAAMLTEAALNLLGCGVTRNLTELRLDGETAIAITDACGGIEQLGALLLAGAALAWLMQSRIVWRALHWSMVLPAVVIANAVRLTATVVLYRAVGDWALGDGCHVAFGWLQTALAVALLWGAGRMIKWASSD